MSTAVPGQVRPAVAVAAWALGAYGVAVGIVIAIASATTGFFAVTDVGYYWRLADRMALGLRPYRDFQLEYPPLAALLFRIPHGFGEAYPLVFAALMFGFGAVTAIVVAFAAPAWSWRARTIALLTFAASVAATGAILANRFDTVVAFVLAGAVALALRERDTAASAVLGVGFALKLTPAIALPVLLVSSRRRWRGVAAFAVAAAVPFLPHLRDPLLGRLLSYHAERPVQFESLLATPFLVAHALGHIRAVIVLSHGSQAVVAPGIETVAALSLPLQAIAIAGTCAVIWLRRHSLSKEELPLGWLAVFLAFLGFGKVLSPQFLVWLLPLVALAAVRHPRLAALLVAVLALTQLEFPTLFRALVALEPHAIAVVTLRNAGILAAWLVALAELLRGSGGLPGSSTGLDGIVPAGAPARRGG